MLISAQNAHEEIEAATIARLQRRDHTALALVYDVQETFLRVWMRAGSFDARRGPFGCWLFTIARNRTLDHLRSCEHTRSAIGRRSSGSEGLEQIEDPGLLADLERSICLGHNRSALRGALEKLNPNQRAVIDFAYFGGYTQTEIAAKLGYPLGTVKTWVRGALKILSHELRVAPPRPPG
jgi:RNA polymerase sigma-70 factor (ECF subfamily)